MCGYCRTQIWKRLQLIMITTLTYNNRLFYLLRSIKKKWGWLIPRWRNRSKQKNNLSQTLLMLKLEWDEEEGCSLVKLKKVVSRKRSSGLQWKETEDDEFILFVLLNCERKGSPLVGEVEQSVGSPDGRKEKKESFSHVEDTQTFRWYERGVVLTTIPRSL